MQTKPTFIFAVFVVVMLFLLASCKKDQHIFYASPQDSEKFFNLLDKKQVDFLKITPRKLSEFDLLVKFCANESCLYSGETADKNLLILNEQGNIAIFPCDECLKIVRRISGEK